MKIKLANGTELTPLLVTGAQINAQGARRDSLTFIFPATESMEALDKAFSENACETITVIDDKGVENLYKSYVIRTKMEKAIVEVSPATSESDAVYDERISVTMAQRTYVESQLALIPALNALLTGEEN